MKPADVVFLLLYILIPNAGMQFMKFKLLWVFETRQHLKLSQIIKSQ